jgi:hypothetical protein
MRRLSRSRIALGRAAERPLRKYPMPMAAPIAWDATVAIAAPLTPQRTGIMRRASRPMFTMAPEARTTIAVLMRPSARMRTFVEDWRLPSAVPPSTIAPYRIPSLRLSPSAPRNARRKGSRGRMTAAKAMESTALRAMRMGNTRAARASSLAPRNRE